MMPANANTNPDILASQYEENLFGLHLDFKANILLGESEEC